MLQPDDAHDGIFLRGDYDGLEAGGFDRAIRVLKTVTRHRGGDQTALRDEPLFHAADESGKGRSAGGLNEDALCSRDECISSEYLIIGHLANVAVGLINGVFSPFPARRVPNANGRRDRLWIGNRFTVDDRGRAGSL